MAEFIAVLKGVFKFWDQVTWFVKTLQDTPAEDREQATQKARAAMDSFKNTGRPTW